MELYPIHTLALRRTARDKSSNKALVAQFKRRIQQNHGNFAQTLYGNSALSHASPRLNLDKALLETAQLVASCQAPRR